MNAMLQSWIQPSALTPHGFCLLWEPGLIWLHAASDLLVALAYFSIPLVILAFVRRRPGFAYRWVAWLFAGFILACGISHLMSVVTLWVPLYWLSGAAKAVTAAVSLVTAMALWRLLPQALALPSPEELHEANAALGREVEQGRALVARLERREAELVEMARTLEGRVERRTQALAATNLRFETALEASGVTVFTQDERLAYTYTSRGGLGRTAEQIIGRDDAELLPALSRDEVSAFKLGVIACGKGGRAEFRIGTEWFELTCSPLPEGGGILCTAIDITRRKEDEARIRFLLNEVKHRVGNLLAVAQAMLNQVAAGASSADDVVERFGTRLRALGHSQRLLVADLEDDAELRDVVTAQVAHFDDDPAARIAIEGPPLRLSSAAVLHIGMAMHELATNSAKYGAWSSPQGRVEVRWEVAQGTCRLSWRESGGPPVRPPARRGFGREVVDWAVAHAVGGEVALDFAPEGLAWELVFPV